MASETISVVLATYNGAAYLEAQLQSLLAQTRVPDEIIIADDGSEDGSLAIAARILRDSAIRVRLTRNPYRYGYADNFLRAAAGAAGSWIAFCDQDDVWRPDKLERCGRFFAAPGVLAVTHNANLIQGSTLTSEVVDRGIRRTDVLSPSSACPWRMFPGFSLVFRRELIADIPFEDRPLDQARGGLKVAHDEWISFLALSLGEVALLVEPLVAYRMHASNASRASWAPSSWVEHAQHALGRSSADIARLAAAAQDRADFLAAHPCGRFAGPARARAVARYRRLAALTRRRLEVWQRPTAAGRLGALCSLWRAGGYGSPRREAAGARELLKDALLGAARVQRLAAASS